jgi:hypothetical protein
MPFCVCARLSIARRVAPYFDAGAVTCEVYELQEVDAAAAAGPLAVVELPKPDLKDHSGFLSVPTATVVLTGLTPGTRRLARSRCVAGGSAWRWELPWSEAAVVVTLRPPRLAATRHPPEVVRVASTHVTLRVRNLGERCQAVLVCSSAGLAGLCLLSVVPPS